MTPVGALLRAVMDQAIGALHAVAPTATAWLGKAPASAALPYAVLNLQDSGGGEYRTSTDEVTESFPIQFMVVAYGAEQASEMVAEIEKVFQSTSLTLAAGTFQACYSGPQAFEPDPELDEEGREVWLGRLIIEFRIQRSLV